MGLVPRFSQFSESYFPTKVSSRFWQFASDRSLVFGDLTKIDRISRFSNSSFSGLPVFQRSCAPQRAKKRPASAMQQRNMNGTTGQEIFRSGRRNNQKLLFCLPSLLSPNILTEQERRERARCKNNHLIFTTARRSSIGATTSGRSALHLSRVKIDLP